MGRRTPKPAASLEAIAQAEGMSVSAVTMLLPRALRKLRREGLFHTCQKSEGALDNHRNAEHTVRGVKGR
jgi:hypothetical protein